MGTINPNLDAEGYGAASTAAQQVEGPLSDAVLKLAEDYETLIHAGCFTGNQLQSVPGLKAQAQKIAEVFKALETPKATAAHDTPAPKQVATSKH